MAEQTADPFDVRHQVQVSSQGARRLRAGHLWVYDGDVTGEPEGSEPALVKVADAAKNCLGYAFYSPRSRIR
ncbi:MAG: hypothetical protein ABIG68_06055, partial [Acidobacteriota bacterium]